MQASAKETPFQLIGAAAKALVLVPSHVNNTGPYNFLLDSGATHCLISPELASNLGIQSESEEEDWKAAELFNYLLRVCTQWQWVRRNKKTRKSSSPTISSESAQDLRPPWMARSDSLS